MRISRDFWGKFLISDKVCIPVYWIINLVDRQVEVYSSPARGRYRSTQVYQPGQNVPVVIDDSQIGVIAVNDIRPRHR